MTVVYPKVQCYIFFLSGGVHHTFAGEIHLQMLSGRNGCPSFPRVFNTDISLIFVLRFHPFSPFLLPMLLFISQIDLHVHVFLTGVHGGRNASMTVGLGVKMMYLVHLLFLSLSSV